MITMFILSWCYWCIPYINHSFPIQWWLWCLWVFLSVLLMHFLCWWSSSKSIAIMMFMSSSLDVANAFLLLMVYYWWIMILMFMRFFLGVANTSLMLIILSLVGCDHDDEWRARHGHTFKGCSSIHMGIRLLKKSSIMSTLTLT